MLIIDGLMYDMTYTGVQVTPPSNEELQYCDVVNVVVEEIECKKRLIECMTKKFHPFEYNCVHFICEVLGVDLLLYTPISLYRLLVLDKVP